MDARLDPAKYAGLAEGDVHAVERVMTLSGHFWRRAWIYRRQLYQLANILRQHEECRGCPAYPAPYTGSQ
jgi:hypothetical protein